MIGISKKELLFSFFKKNPEALNSIEDTQYIELLEIKISTYKKYKIEYRSIIEAKKDTEIKPRDSVKYFKGKPREKFTFDDYKLFF